MNGPDGEWTDAAHNLYVANYAGIYVNEYTCTAGHTPGCANSPSFTYSSGLGDPIGVSTDQSGNVFVADFGFGTAGFVAEYAQGSNSQTANCPVPGGAEGVAIDSSTGNVFVDWVNLSSGASGITEFAGGLSGCPGTTLPVTLTFAGGMSMDNAKGLVVNDQLGPSIDLIPPPYTTISGTCGSGYSDPFHNALTKGNARLYVADIGNANVQVLAYPACTNITTLSGGTLVDPAGVTNTYNGVT
jgi:hypothetical protein